MDDKVISDKVKSESNLKADWDKIGQTYLQDPRLVKQIENWYTYYVGRAYFKAFGKGISYFNQKEKIKLLKTDLWEEVVEKGRSFLENEKLVKENNLDLYAIDCSSVLVSKAKKVLKGVKIKQGDIRKLPYDKNYFNIILDLSTLDHIPLADQEQVFKEYNRVLDKDGILVLVFLRKSPLLSLISFFAKLRGQKQLVDNLTCFASGDMEVKEKLGKDFLIKEEYCLGSILLLSLLTRGARFLINKPPYSFLNQILKLEYHSHSRIFLSAFSELYLIIAQKK